MPRLHFNKDRYTVLELEEVGDDVMLTAHHPEDPKKRINVALIRARGEHDFSIIGIQ